MRCAYKNFQTSHTSYRLLLQKMQRVIKFNQKAWLKPYINVNAELGKNEKLI